MFEASQLTYIRGQWINMYGEGLPQTEFGYQIVASILPANGNYSAYNAWGVYFIIWKNIFIILMDKSIRSNIRFPFFFFFLYIFR